MRLPADPRISRPILSACGTRTFRLPLPLAPPGLVAAIYHLAAAMAAVAAHLKKMRIAYTRGRITLAHAS